MTDAMKVKEALAEEPVAWIVLSHDQQNVRIWWRRKDLADEWSKIHSAPLIPLYAHPRCADAILPLAPSPAALDPVTVEAGMRECPNCGKRHHCAPIRALIGQPSKD